MSDQSELQDLKSAFSLFMEASKTLEAEYAALNQRVQSLDADLVRAHQTVSTLLDALPAAVILVEFGAITQYNQAALSLVPTLKPGEKWDIPMHWQPSGRTNEFKVSTETTVKNLQLTQISVNNRIVIQIQDITDNVKAVADQEKIDRLIAMGELSASIAHQIRTPLSTAILYCDHLKSDALNTEKRKLSAEKIQNQLLYLDRLTSKMLRFIGAQAPLTKNWNLNSLVQMSFAQVEGISKRNSVKIDINLHPSDIQVMADKDMLCSAIVAVLENAVQASKIGGKFVRIDVRSNSDRHEVLIQDSGPGISEKMVNRLFEPFATDRSTGTGLGLSVAQNTLRAHNGSISGFNRPSGGATFIISLPVLL
jgi:two-component system sensor histidine kinase FlrB